MSAYLNEDFLTLPLVLDSSDFQSLGLLNYNGFQLELSKDQPVPLVIFESGDGSSETPLTLASDLTISPLFGKEDVNNTNTKIQLEPTVVNANPQSYEASSTEDNSHLSNSSEDLNDLIERVVTYKCKLCSFKSPEKSFLSAHLKEVHSKDVKPKDQPSLNKDVKKEDSPAKTAYMCAKCSEAFGSFSEWRAHLASAHKVVMSVKSILENTAINGGPPIIDLTKKERVPPPTAKTESKKIVVLHKKEKKIACTVRSCMVRLSSREMVEKHKECHAGPRQFACPQCAQPFRKWGDCANHMWSSHSQDIDLYSCPTCEYKTAVRTKFENHIKIHSDVREFVCKECGKSFKQALQLKNHHVSHLKALGSPDIPNWSKKQECPQCKRSFYDGKSLKKHIQSVHSNLRPYVCQVCGHTSANKNRLGIHLRQHTGEKPFSCPLCSFATGDQNCLRRHAWRHLHVRPYSCPHCSYSCIQSNSLKNHIKAQHPGAPGILSCPKCSFTSLSKLSLESHTAKAHTTSNENKEKSLENGYTGENCSELGGETHGSRYSDVEMDEESQNCFEVPIVDTGGITIPAD